MKVKFEEKFEEVLKEESKGFGIDWSLVDIESIHYHSTLLTDLPMTLDKYTVRVNYPSLKTWACAKRMPSVHSTS